MKRTQITLAALGVGLLAAAPAAGQSPDPHARHARAAADTTRRERPAADSARRRAGAPRQAPAPRGTRPGPTGHGGHGEKAAAPAPRGTPDAHAAHRERAAPAPAGRDGGHRMWTRPLGSGWSLAGMAQAVPVLTAGEPLNPDSPLSDSEVYLTQPATMLRVESPGRRLVLSTTLSFEAWTLEDGEYTFGGWGEGFLDKRHPHTLLHEAVVSANLWSAPGGALSLSAGKGFAPYGTEDPMGRPAVKFPTNHHLSQIPERWVVSGAYLHRSGLSVEAGVFGGGEPEGPYDLGNVRSFGDSWSARVAQRLGGGSGAAAPWELSASVARVREAHGDTKEATRLVNGAVRHQAGYGFGSVYALAEASRSEPEAEEGYWSLLGETRLGLGRGERHRPYYRVEYATRPEFHREGAPGSDPFFRYDHGHGHVDGATRWLVNTVGYGYRATRAPVDLLPFVEVQHSRVQAERGTVDPVSLFGGHGFWKVSAGVRVSLGGGAMRMGSYGVLDPAGAAGAGGHAH